MIEVTEPLGMETLVFFRMNGIDVCGRVSPDAGAREGSRMRLAASLDNMHLIDEASGRVLRGAARRRARDRLRPPGLCAIDPS